MAALVVLGHVWWDDLSLVPLLNDSIHGVELELGDDFAIIDTKRCPRPSMSVAEVIANAETDHE